MVFFFLCGKKDYLFGMEFVREIKKEKLKFFREITKMDEKVIIWSGNLTDKYKSYTSRTLIT